MKTIFVFALVLCVFTINAQTVDCVKEINFEKQGSVLFPEVKHLEGSDEINKYLLDYLKNAFYIKSEKTLMQSLEEARFKGLDSLTYLAFETDSTFSVALTFSLKRACMNSTWVDFFTFSKNSGKIMSIYDMFPDINKCKISYTMISLIHSQIELLRHKASKLFADNVISRDDFIYLYFVINKVLLGSIPFENGFLLYRNHLYLKNGILLPQKIGNSIPEYFIIDVGEFKFQAELHDCFKWENTPND